MRKARFNTGPANLPVRTIWRRVAGAGDAQKKSSSREPSSPSPYGRPKPKSNLPFEPHDLSGVWSRTGGDRGMSSRPGVNVPAMTPAGQKLFDASKPGYGPRAVPPATGNDIVGECNPQGVPRLLFFPRPVEFIQLPNRLIQFFQWHRVLREIWTMDSGAE